MKKIIIILILGAFIAFPSCEVEEILNPNAPTVESFESGATLADLKLLSHGLEGVIRQDMQFHFWTTSIVGREYYDLRGTDPRYTSELLGGTLDNNGFLTTRSYGARYRSVRNANLLKTAVDNTVASLTPSQSNALKGFANTIIGYELLLEATRQYDNGIRLDVADVNALGPFTSDYQASLAGIMTILDEGYSQLEGTAEDVIFNLSGFSSIPVSETEALAQFNRAIAARVAIYQNNKADALSLLDLSFMDLEGGLDIGAYYSFGGATGNDLPNPLFYVPGVDNYMAERSWFTDADTSDTRLSKVTDTGESIAQDGISSPYQVSVYSSNTDPASIVRNEELILIYAEAQIGTDNAKAVEAINIIRGAAGLAAYDGPMDDGALVTQMLHERRYSLFGEGHRWIDMRRYDRLGELPVDRENDNVHIQFPTPASEDRN